MHIVEGRVVASWVRDGLPSGVITGKWWKDSQGFEVDHIVRYPHAPSGTGEEMCKELLPEMVRVLNLKWIMVKIHDNLNPEWLRGMATRFGFKIQERQGTVEFWRKDL